MKNLYQQLQEYGESDYYPFHMPGHKRNQTLFSMVNPYQLDITEIDGFDNLHEASGILKEAMKKASQLYHSEETYFLINGSTSGILASIGACTKRGDRVLVARNCHKSVYHGIFLYDLKPVYIYPPYIEDYHMNGGILPETIRKMLITYPDIKTIIVVSPTYEGVVSDIKKIVQIAHEAGAAVIVDEAHGAHFGLFSSFPESAISMGADIVVQSLHKTLPSFTQTGLLHVNGPLVNRTNLQMYLSIYQSSSPSYLLMAGIDQCIGFIHNRGEKLFFDYFTLLEEFYKESENLSMFHVLQEADILFKSGVYRLDPSKLVISINNAGMTGVELYEILLQKYHLQMEMVTYYYVLGMTGAGDEREGFLRLFNALKEIESDIKSKSLHQHVYQKESMEKIQLDMVITPFEAYNKERKWVPLENSVGCLAGDYIFLYPPGIPLAVPGERINVDFIRLLQRYQQVGLQVKGLSSKGEMAVIQFDR